MLVVVPARGGSKGVKLKNIQKVKGVSLVARVAQIVTQLPFVDRAIVSTDHGEIARIAKDEGLDVPFVRPEKLSGDRVSDWDVLNHALLKTEELDETEYGIVLMLQPTCPLRRPEHVTAAIEKLVEGEYDAVWTVSETDPKHHPLKQLVLEDGDLQYYDSKGATIIARQQLKPIYHRNGAAYAITRECLLGELSIMGKKTGAVIVDEPLVSIDTTYDFKLIEWLIDKNLT